MLVNDKNLKAHKITNIFYLIIIIPFLLLALLSATVMFNAKKAGGYANIFGYYVVELENDNFHNEQTGEFKKGTKQMFKATSYDNLKSGDIVVCYSGEAPETKNGDTTDWLPISANISQASTFSSKAEKTSPVKVVKIGELKKIATTSDGNKYTLFSYYESSDPTSLVIDKDKLIVGDDIIGVAIPSSAFVADTINFAKSIESLFLFVFLPCALLLLIKLMSLSYYQKYEKQIALKRKGKIINEEQMSYAQIVNANKAKNNVPQRPTRVSSVKPSMQNNPGIKNNSKTSGYSSKHSSHPPKK